MFLHLVAVDGVLRYKAVWRRNDDLLSGPALSRTERLEPVLFREVLDDFGQHDRVKGLLGKIELLYCRVDDVGVRLAAYGTFVVWSKRLHADRERRTFAVLQRRARAAPEIEDAFAIAEFALQTVQHRVKETRDRSRVVSRLN